MSGAVTWAAIGALVPLVGAAIVGGTILARVNRLVVDHGLLNKDLKLLSRDVQRALETQATHSAQIESLMRQTKDREDALIGLLQERYGVANRRGPDAER